MTEYHCSQISRNAIASIYGPAGGKAMTYGQIVDTLNALRAALSALTDPDPCSLDHHGYCQAHMHLRSGECPHAAAKRLMGEE